MAVVQRMGRGLVEGYGGGQFEGQNNTPCPQSIREPLFQLV